VSDREVHPTIWDCEDESCVRSIDRSGGVGDTFQCPGCGAQYQVVVAPREMKVVRMIVRRVEDAYPEVC
jgi:hypothetical protein